ncbi:hypothetical protein TNCT_153281 [Trichonephila clavata]|uniref:Transposase Tc1-like domain-containing protein n=1 Tax=Trichonephila clavata TaxID=2740835 RepID=A0A8X6G0P5_TRICU|nr:hypothetical protein TNCT_153281 [Trichonephila clavata]
MTEPSSNRDIDRGTTGNETRARKYRQKTKERRGRDRRLVKSKGRRRKKIMNSITERRVIHQVKIDPKISAPKIAASTSNTLDRSVSAETVRSILRKAGYNGRVAR